MHRKANLTDILQLSRKVLIREHMSFLEAILIHRPALNGVILDNLPRLFRKTDCAVIIDLKTNSANHLEIIMNHKIPQPAWNQPFRTSSTTVSTWLERVVLIALSEPKSSLSQVISPQNPLNLQEQVKAKILENACISVNRSRGIYGFFMVLGVLPLLISQRHFGNSSLSIEEQATVFSKISCQTEIYIITSDNA